MESEVQNTMEPMARGATNRTFELGGELEVGRIGYGAMRLTGSPGNYGPFEDWEAGVALLRRAFELGVNFFDSAHSYGPEWADRILAAALRPAQSGAVVATKGGVGKPGPGEIVVDASPTTLASQIDLALRNLEVERIDLFQLHRVDPSTPIEESVGALAAAKRAGKVRLIGLSNVSREELDRALQVAPIASVQNRYNRSERGDEELVDYTASLGIAFLPYGPLGAHPMRPGAALPAREALAWLLARSPNIVVIPGTTSIPHLEENLRAWESIGTPERA